MDPLSLVGFGSSGDDAQLKLTAPSYSLIFLFVLAFCIYGKKNRVPRLLDVPIQKITGTETTGVLLFRDGMHWPDCLENYAALHLDNMPWLSQKLHFVISIFRHFLFFMFRI